MDVCFFNVKICWYLTVFLVFKKLPVALSNTWCLSSRWSDVLEKAEPRKKPNLFLFATLRDFFYIKI